MALPLPEMGMLQFYIKSALKSIQRKKIFSLLNVAGLSIGITVFLLALEFYSYETGFNTFHLNLPHLYRLNVISDRGVSPSTVPNLAPLLQGNIPGIKAAVRVADNFNSGALISYLPNRDPTKEVSFREEGCVFVDKAFLTAFTFPLIEGTNRLDNPHAVIITASVAQKIFGTERAVGQTIELRNQFGVLPCEVTGVVADLPRQSDLRFDYLFSMDALKDPSYTEGADWAKPDNWGNDSYTTYTLLDDNADPHKIAEEASRLWMHSSPQYKKEDGRLTLQPVSEIHLGKSFSDDNPTFGSRVMTYAILDLGILVLIIAWINFINFSTAFALSQAKDIGIHKIIGSGKKQIVWRYVMESFVLNAVGLLVAVLLSGIVQHLFNYLTAKSLSLNDVNHWSTWLIGGAVLVTGVGLCGGYVGWILSKFKPVRAITFNDGSHKGRVLLRKGLVVFQFAISILFIIATMVAYQQVRFMKHQNLGMTLDNLVVLYGPEIRDSSINTHSLAFKNDLTSLSFVQGLSMTGSVPGADFAHNFSMDGITPPHAVKGDETKNYFVSMVDENYFSLYHIPIVSGRDFTSDEVGKGFKAGKWIVNETAAKAMGLQPESAVHQVIRWNDKDWEILAVIKDYHHRSLKDVIEPIIYIPQNNINRYTVKVAPDHLAENLVSMKSLYAKYFPGNPFGYEVLQEAYDGQYTNDQRSVTIALSMSVLIILISCLGLIGLSVFTAQRRAKEISIRKVLGASFVSLFSLLSRDFLLLVVVAFLIASPVAWFFMNKWLQNFAYHIGISGWLFTAAGGVALTIALFTVSVQALKAVLIAPVIGLRKE